MLLQEASVQELTDKLLNMTPQDAAQELSGLPAGKVEQVLKNLPPRQAQAIKGVMKAGW